MGRQYDLAPEVEVEDWATPTQPTPAPYLPPEEEYEELLPEEEAPVSAAGRGVFDTETLAAIYVNQGFYGRAAEIYQRLIAQRPGDTGLRGKLEERAGPGAGGGGVEEPVAPAAPARRVRPAAGGRVAPAAVHASPRRRAGPEEMISQLQTLLETFKGGRPR